MAAINTRPVRTFLLTLAALLLTSCAQINYYGQSIAGHTQLMLARQSLDSAIEDAEQNEDTKLLATLQAAKHMREFASNELGLKDNGSYRSYVALQRDYPVWVVVAADEFSVTAKQWCYLVIGCASYRGFFKLDSAREFAKDLQRKGYETSLGGAPAYSTLGWFNDPLLPSMFTDGDAVLAETLFHELAHQVLYVNGESDFNEAFATVVGERGAQMWLSQFKPALLASYQQRTAAYNEFVELLLASRERLQAVYALQVDEVEKRVLKKSEFMRLRQEYQDLKAERWRGIGWFDRWFDAPINNARLTAVATYRDQVPLLDALFVACGEDFSRYYQRLQRLKKNKKTKPFVIPQAC